MPRFRFAFLILPLLAGMAGCGGRGDDGPIEVSVVGARADLTDPVKRLPSPGSKALLEASAQGLVAFDANGDIVPALAERWIVEDNGLSYLFRIRPAKWPDGDTVKADEVAALLNRRIRDYVQPDLRGDLEAVSAIVPMTGEVIELRLAAPRPNFLQILAQPQMAITRDDGGAGPFRRRFARGVMTLTPVPDPLDDGEDGDAAPNKPRDKRVLRAERAAVAIVRFRRGEADLVLGGRYQDLPLLNNAGLRRNAIQFDPAPGLFGLAVVGASPFLADHSVRQALDMAIERERLPATLSVGRWGTATTILPAQLDMAAPPQQPGWASMALADRQTLARQAVAPWLSGGKTLPVLKIGLPAGPGSTLLFALIAANFRQIGIQSQMVAWDDGEADLRLIDEVAPYDSALWYLNRLGCGRIVLCSQPAADATAQAATAADLPSKQQFMTAAEAAAVDFTNFLPLGEPVRWSLVGGRIDNFVPNARARHPLNQLTRPTN